MRRLTDISPVEETRLVGLIGEEIDKVADSFTSEAGWERLTRHFLDMLRASASKASPVEGVSWAKIIVEWARAGHPSADRALRRYGREMGEHDRFDQMLVSVRAYCLEAADKRFNPFPRGRHAVGSLMRNLWIPALLDHVADATGMPATRSGGNPAPSIAYLLSQAYKKKGVRLKETEINRIYWARAKLPATMEASMPLIAAP